jgi:hypothetical protein
MRSSRFRLGVTQVNYGDNDDQRGPVGRVHDLLFVRGTTPEYTLPVLDGDLERELLHAFEPLPADPPFDVATPAALAAFLSANLGNRMAPDERTL